MRPPPNILDIFKALPEKILAHRGYFWRKSPQDKAL